MDTRIRELVAYARERDGEDRTLLFRNLVDLFLTDKAPSKQPTRDQLLDVIEALIPHVEAESRRTVADLLAGMSEPPLDLALRLAKDETEIVAELLKAASFDEEAILALIDSTGRDHHHMIASRPDLSANVWIALARAAPAAPSLEPTPSLSLWSDTLGGGAPQPASATNVTSLPDANGNGKKTIARPAAPKAAPAPETRQAAQLRILRTDKDLIADRLEKSTETLETKPVGAESPVRPGPVKTEEPQPPAAAAPSRPVMEATAGQEASIGDPGPGGWAWHSDRDGFVRAVSPHGARLFSDDVTLEGLSILDMLGLNAKLGHPVSRAFQRRSAIHDAPLTLDSLEDNRAWTLEATPIFSAQSGIFEGYEGVMTPVLANDPTVGDLFADPEPPVELFIGDAAPAALEVPASLTDENIDRTAVPPPAPTPAEEAAATPEHTSGQTATPKDAPKDAADAPSIPDIAAKAITDLVSDALKAPAEDLSETTPAVAEAASGAPTTEIAATLDMLERSLEALLADADAGAPGARLQAEIAGACLRTLRAQLKKSSD